MVYCLSVSTHYLEVFFSTSLQDSCNFLFFFLENSNFLVLTYVPHCSCWKPCLEFPRFLRTRILFNELYTCMCEYEYIYCCDFGVGTSILWSPLISSDIVLVFFVSHYWNNVEITSPSSLDIIIYYQCAQMRQLCVGGKGWREMKNARKSGAAIWNGVKNLNVCEWWTTQCAKKFPSGKKMYFLIGWPNMTVLRRLRHSNPSISLFVSSRQPLIIKNAAFSVGLRRLCRFRHCAVGCKCVLGITSSYIPTFLHSKYVPWAQNLILSARWDQSYLFFTLPRHWKTNRMIDWSE